MRVHSRTLSSVSVGSQSHTTATAWSVGLGGGEWPPANPTEAAMLRAESCRAASVLSPPASTAQSTRRCTEDAQLGTMRAL